MKSLNYTLIIEFKETSHYVIVVDPETNERRKKPFPTYVSKIEVKAS